MNILIVEDEEYNLVLIKDVTEMFYPEAKISVAMNGKEGYDILINNSFDIILSDINMPEMNGYELIDKIRNELQLSIPAVAITAFAIKGDKEKILDAGFDDYISKPIDINEVQKLLSKYLD